VAQLMGHERGVDARDPELAVLALLLLPADERVLHRVHHGLVGLAAQRTPRPEEALRALEQLLGANLLDLGALDTSHGGPLLGRNAACSSLPGPSLEATLGR